MSEKVKQAFYKRLGLLCRSRRGCCVIGHCRQHTRGGIHDGIQDGLSNIKDAHLVLRFVQALLA